MAKFLYLAVVSLAIGLSLAHGGDHGHWYDGIIRAFATPTSICFNGTTATSYLTKILTTINSCQANTTCNPVLQLESSNFVLYVKDASKQAVLYTDCPTFVTGLKAAKALDNKAEHTRQQIAHDIHHRFEQVLHNVTGNGPNELDSSELYGHHGHYF